jgi:hypothetical protein
MFLTPDKTQCWALILSTGNSFLIGRQGARNSCCLAYIASCHQIRVCAHFVWSGYIQRVSECPVLNAFVWQAFLSATTSILTRKQCARTSCCNPWHLLTRDRVSLPFTWKCLFCPKIVLLTLWNPQRYAVLLSKANSIEIAKQIVRPSFL